MTDPTAPPEPMTDAPGDVGTPRGSLFRKYLIVLLFLVGGVLVASSLVELYFSYRETQVGVVRVEREKAAAAAIRIEQFVKEIERQVRATVQPGSTEALGTGPSREGALLTEQRELDFLRLLRNAQAIGELRLVDASGREQLRVSRLALDAVGSGEDLSREEWFRDQRTCVVPTKVTPDRPMGPLPSRISRLSTNRSRTAGLRWPRPSIMAAMPGANAMRSESQRAEGTSRRAATVVTCGRAKPAALNSARKSPSSR